MFKFTIKQENLHISEYTDLTKFDSHNVHQNSITHKAQQCLLNLSKTIKLPDNYKIPPSDGIQIEEFIFEW